MAKQNINSKQGFTIIEVVLVLAIAGLIFLMVFVALPALQRSQRDTQRRNDLSRVDTALTQYQTNHSSGTTTNLPTEAGKVPSGKTSVFNINNNGKFSGCTVDGVANSSSACDFLHEYMNSSSDGNATQNTFQDPDGTYYGIDINAGAFTYESGQMDHIIYIRTGAKCDGDAAVADTSRHYAVLYRLEGSGVYCIDDQ